MDGIAIFFNQDMSVGGTFMDIEKIMKIARERVFQNFIMSLANLVRCRLLTGIMLITLGNTISGLFLTMKGKR